MRKVFVESRCINSFMTLKAAGLIKKALKIPLDLKFIYSKIYSEMPFSAKRKLHIFQLP